MKYLTIVSILLFFNTFCMGQVLLDDSADSTKRAIFIFNTSSGKQVVTHNLLVRSMDVDSIGLLTQKDFKHKYKDLKAFTDVYLFFLSHK